MEALLKQAVEESTQVSRIRAIYRSMVVELGRVQQNCPAHGLYFSHGVLVSSRAGGRGDWSGCHVCVEVHRELEAQRKEAYEAAERQRAIDSRIEASGVPLRFQGKHPADYRAETDAQQKVLGIAQDYIDRFAAHREKGWSLIFAGLPGTGKSLLAMIALQEIVRRGYGARYTTMQGMVLAVRRTWGKEGEGRETDVLDEYANTSLLVLDEIGVQAGTENEKALLFEVIDRRYADMRPTIFATNLNSTQFKEFVGDRIWDRLTENSRWVPFAWESYRPTARKEMAQ